MYGRSGDRRRISLEELWTSMVVANGDLGDAGPSGHVMRCCLVAFVCGRVWWDRESVARLWSMASMRVRWTAAQVW